ncbi:hypothetical protein AB0N73_07530 [Microbacterium sp. NPDC089189]|uniref:alginate O-acetyltransferase AlgX-related protein n=1 Tax=Microbacterium sp. NPDC089189 TaxID=3154972 RepID=UPI003426FED4
MWFVIRVLGVAALVVVTLTALRLTTGGYRVEPVAVLAPATADSVCRPAVDQPDRSLWLDGDQAAEQAWAAEAPGPDDEYIVGPNGWLFWSDFMESYASQAVGRAHLDAQEIQRWIDYLTSVRDGLAADGIEFIVVVPPSTSSVYPEELPEWMQDLRGPTIMDQLLDSSSDLPIVDMRTPLRDAKGAEHPIYSASNSHWTPYGAYVGWQQIAECTPQLYPEQQGLRTPIVAGVSAPTVANEWVNAGAESIGPDWSTLEFGESFQPVTRTDAAGVISVRAGEETTDAADLPASTSVPTSWTGKSAVILRDSMGNDLSPYWQQAYSPTWQLPSDADLVEFPSFRDYVSAFSPDVVIFELAERHLINVPPAGRGYE